MKVLHVMYQSYPNVSGSSTRSRAIVNSQKALGLIPSVLTSPFQKGVTVNQNYEMVDDIKYYRCFNENSDYLLGKKKSLWVRVKKFFLIIPFFIDVYKIAKMENVAVIHSHAMFFCGIPAILVCKLLNIPHVYEIRSDWSQNSNFKASRSVKSALGIIEKIVVKMSKNIVVISKGLEAKYGALCKTATFVGNAVPNQVIEQGENYPPLFTSKVIKLGYLGSVIELEGLSFVLDALNTLPRDNFHLLIVGDGNNLPTIKKRVEELGLNNVKITGEVSPENIPELYKEIDVVINYRVDEPVAHSVTPLKPLEAMAYKRLVITSDVKGMTELVMHNETGIVVPANRADLLAVELKKIEINKEHYIQIANNGAQHVKNYKSWLSNAEKYVHLYSGICEKSSDIENQSRKDNV